MIKAATSLVTEKVKNFSMWKEVISAILGGLFAISGSMIISGPNRLSAEASYVSTLQDRIAVLEENVETLRSKNIELQIDLLAVTTEMRQSINSEQVICDFLQSLPGDHIAKIRPTSSIGEDESFKILCVDPSLYDLFGGSPLMFIGQKDMEIWPENTANIITSNDFQVYRTRGKLTTTETWTNFENKSTRLEIVRFFHVVGSNQMIIAEIEM